MGLDKTWGKPYGLSHGVGHSPACGLPYGLQVCGQIFKNINNGLPCGLTHALPVVRFLET